MAIYHLSQGVISRSTGRSAVQSAAYTMGAKLQESRRGLTANYQNRARDVFYAETLAPAHASAWAKDASQVWDRLESFEDTYAERRYHTLETQEKYKSCAQTAMTVVVALPRALSLEVSQELVAEFANTRFVSRGLVVSYALHQDEGNPHAHLLISRRRLEEDGFPSWTKDREICKKSELKVTRKLWADLANHYLAREGLEARITEKSFLDLGIELLPSQHRGWMADKLSEKGLQSRLIFDNQEISLANRHRLLEKPETILEEMTSHQATFTQLDLLKRLQKRLGDEEALVAQVFAGALQQAVVVGEGLEGMVRYTSDSYKQLEEKAFQQTETLASQTYPQQISAPDLDRVLQTSSVALTAEQQQAVRGLVGEQRLAVLVGRAGTGKTTTLRQVAKVYHQAGHQVIGTSLAALAAETLGKEADIESKTLHSWLYSWQRYEAAQQKFLSFNSIVTEGVLKQLDWYRDLQQFAGSALTAKHVVIVDEASMIGTRQWQDLLHYVNKSGAKLIAVGEAGDFFRAIVSGAHKAGSLSTLQDIRRQRIGWMREASQKLAQLDTQEALQLYEHHGHVIGVDPEEKVAKIAQAYGQRRQTPQAADPSARDAKVPLHMPQGLVLAATREECHHLNQAIREQLKVQGLLSAQEALQLQNKSYALGETVVFLKNEKKAIQIVDEHGLCQKDLFIQNGNRGIVRAVQAVKTEQTTEPSWRVTVEMANPPGGLKHFAVFETSSYDHLDHGYAVTLHKAQGQTVDFTLIAASRLLDAKALYVALTRHRYEAQLYYSTQEFAHFKDLATHLSRFQDKDLVKDYTIRPENAPAHQRVQEYKLAALDAAAILKQGHAEGQVDWQAYQATKAEQKQRGREILADFSHHKLYVQQSGLTQEMLQISTGLKARPLSKAEEEALKRVELYSELAQEVRKVWRTMKMTSKTSGQQPTNQRLYADFHRLRDERDGLAAEIVRQEIFHREFIKTIAQKLGYGRGVLVKQAAAYEERQRQVTVQGGQEGLSVPQHALKTRAEAGLGSLLAQVYNKSYGKQTQKAETLWRKCLGSVRRFIKVL